MEWIKGDLLEADLDYYCHQVNCQGKMGSGIAKSIKEKWPIVYDKYIEAFGNSSCYDVADSTFDILIKPNLNRMKQSQIEKILENINKNNQLYNRGKAKFDNNQIIEKSNVDWNKIDLKKYSNFEYDEDILISNQLPF